MPKATVQPLSLTAFQKYGAYANMTPPSGPRIGKPPIEFYRDMLQLDLGGKGIASFSVCRVEKRPAVVDVAEFHDGCGEGVLPLDGDILLQVGIATPDGKPPSGQIEIFRVPRGTMAVLRAGVWHHAPFAAGAEAVNVLVVLPERTYSMDCRVVELAKARQVTFGA